MQSTNIHKSLAKFYDSEVLIVIVGSICMCILMWYGPVLLFRETDYDTIIFTFKSTDVAYALFMDIMSLIGTASAALMITYIGTCAIWGGSSQEKVASLKKFFSLKSAGWITIDLCLFVAFSIALYQIQFRAYVKLYEGLGIANIAENSTSYSKIVKVLYAYQGKYEETARKIRDSTYTRTVYFILQDDGSVTITESKPTAILPKSLDKSIQLSIDKNISK